MTILPRLVLAFLCLSSANPSPARSTGYNTGMPFGRIGPSEINELDAYAKKHEVDLMGDMRRAYQKDAAALARVFAFSLKFHQLDRNARTYGQLVYSSFLNLAELHGSGRYAELVAAQPAAVRQRIRDFIYYDATQAPRKHRKEAEAALRATAPTLFPKDYSFGAGQSIFRGN